MMAKKKNGKSSGDSVTIFPLPGTDPFPVAPTFTVSGSGSPDGAIVTGILTDTDTGETIACDADQTINLGDWGPMQFSNVPPGTYVLSANETGTNDGADAINVEVAEDPVVVDITAGSFDPSGTTLTVTVSSTDPNYFVAAVIAASKPKPCEPPRKQKGKNQYKFTFKGLTKGTTYDVTAYPIKKNSHGKTKSFKDT
jgi:hypothetical protein